MKGFWGLGWLMRLHWDRFFYFLEGPIMYFCYNIIFFAAAAETSLFCPIALVGIGWVAGFSADCLLALLTFLSGLQCFHWLRPYPNTQHDSHAPGTQRQLKVLHSNLERLCSFCIYSCWCQLGWLPETSVILIPTVIGWRCALEGRSCSQAPKRICCGCDSSAGICVFFVSNRWNVR